MIDAVREASRRLVRELGFMRSGLAGTKLPASAVHALIEIGANRARTAADLSAILNLEKSSVSRMLAKLLRSGLLKERANLQDRRAKLLALTAKGRKTRAAIDAFAHTQVSEALETLPPAAQSQILAGISVYADALHTIRTGVPAPTTSAVTIESGYRPGLIGRCAEMHGRYYSRRGFGSFFESKVAAGLAEFVPRLDRPINQIWTAIDNGQIVGAIAIDGEDLGRNTTHLRWFIVDDGYRGHGLGKRLLAEAVSFCDRQGFAEIHLWTVKGLDAARRLYEAAGFQLAEQYSGDQWGSQMTEQCFVRPMH